MLQSLALALIDDEVPQVNNIDSVFLHTCVTTDKTSTTTY